LKSKTPNKSSASQLMECFYYSLELDVYHTLRKSRELVESSVLDLSLSSAAIIWKSLEDLDGTIDLDADQKGRGSVPW
jgi:hypothetical protein